MWRGAQFYVVGHVVALIAWFGDYPTYPQPKSFDVNAEKDSICIYTACSVRSAELVAEIQIRYPKSISASF